MKREAYIGKRYGTWLVVRVHHTHRPDRKCSVLKLECSCDCGHKRTFRTYELGRHCPKCSSPALQVGTAEAEAAYKAASEMVAEVVGIEAKEIRERDRSAFTASARRLVAHMLKAAGFSYPKIGDVMHRNHVSVMRMCGKGTIEDAAELVADFAAAFEQRAKSPSAAMQKSKLAEFRAQSRMRAREIREKLVVLKVKPPEEQRVTDRQLWDETVATLPKLTLHDRKPVWRDACKRLWPYNWEQQLATPPAGIEVGA